MVVSFVALRHGRFTDDDCRSGSGKNKTKFNRDYSGISCEMKFNSKLPYWFDWCRTITYFQLWQSIKSMKNKKVFLLIKIYMHVNIIQSLVVVIFLVI